MRGSFTVAVAVCLAIGSSVQAAGPLPVQGRSPSRELWQIDQLQLPLDTPASVLKALEPDHSMAAVIRRLRSLGIAFRRVRLTVTPDRLVPAMRDWVLNVPPGEPFVNREPGYISVNVLLGRRLPSNVVELEPRGARLPLAQKA